MALLKRSQKQRMYNPQKHPLTTLIYLCKRNLVLDPRHSSWIQECPHTHTHTRCCCLLFSHSVMSNSCDPIDCSPPGSSVRRISQARILEWVSIYFCRGSSWPRDQTCVSCISRWILYHWAPREACICMCICVYIYRDKCVCINSWYLCTCVRMCFCIFPLSQMNLGRKTHTR